MSIKNSGGEYHIDRLNSGNLTDLEKLHTLVYDKLPRPGFFAKKYDTAFTAVNYTGFIAYNTQQLPIAFYGVIPCFMRFGDKIVLAAQSADTMTHPRYRNKGLFVQLANLTFQLCHNIGIQLLFGFPNQNSLPGFINKLEWQITEHMDYFILRVSPFLDGARFFRKLPVLKNFHNVYAGWLLKKYLLPQQGIDNSVFVDGYAGVYRDHQYLKYKTYSTTQVIKIGPSTLWVKLSNELVIGDMARLPADFDGVIARLRKLSRKLGLKEIHFHASPGTTLHALFAERFNPIPSFPVIFKDLAGGTVINKIKFTTADIDTF